ncbi:uncharacterized protein I303_103137 [Kwoniella dejecticola CBS 10117]|uniref:Uncharacterized protein n=1 Tax=Kwoniella dejecticola CBS 10117 TaxID=1296121 RepID=A0A1A6AAP7_9TREE|nr:uncharacterized protein I303_03157 [Kwoniella dejecticola CBS 10117]OBR87133.1 hypothetical protein I303_03157 [Kwoniella dejecticola CBS 10117]
MSRSNKPDTSAIGQSIAKHILLLQKEGLSQSKKTGLTADILVRLVQDLQALIYVLKAGKSHGPGGANAEEAPLLDNYRKVSDYFQLEGKPTVMYALGQALSAIGGTHNEDSKLAQEEALKKAAEEMVKSGKAPGF